jgi:pimeloyl-ACP methyl ester carboxylesterase
MVSVSGYLIGSQEAGQAPLPPPAELTWWYQFYFGTERGRAGYDKYRREFARLIWHTASPKWNFDDATFNRTAASFDNPDHVSIVIHNYRWRLSLAAGPFYGFNRPGVEASEPIIDNWWRQGMMGGAKAHYDGIVAFSQTDFTEDLKKITLPALVMHGDDDQIVPYADAGPLSAQLLRNGTLKTYHGFPHGMPTTQADTINADLLAFLRA